MKDIEIRAASFTAENKKLTGYVVQWNSESQPIYGEFTEQFSSGAFADSLAESEDVRALFEHDHTALLGRTSAGTLTLSEDSTGLRFELTPPNTQLGSDVLAQVEAGNISGMSFGFRSLDEEWNFEMEPALRTVNKAELREITVTSIPAYQESHVEVAMRSMAQAKAKSSPDTMRKRWLELEGCK